jgi:hypothetical protein
MLLDDDDDEDEEEEVSSEAGDSLSSMCVQAPESSCWLASKFSREELDDDGAESLAVPI